MFGRIGDQDKYIMKEVEVQAIVQQLTKYYLLHSPSGVDNIPAEFTQNLGDKGMEIITMLMNRTYNSGKLSEDFGSKYLHPNSESTKSRSVF